MSYYDDYSPEAISKMSPDAMKRQALLLSEAVKGLVRDTNECGKNTYGVWNHPHNEAVGILHAVISMLWNAYGGTEQGIEESIADAIEKAEEKGTHVSYAGAHQLSPDSLQIYARDQFSPSGVRRVGSVPNTELAVSCLRGHKIGLR